MLAASVRWLLVLALAVGHAGAFMSPGSLPMRLGSSTKAVSSRAKFGRVGGGCFGLAAQEKAGEAKEDSKPDTWTEAAVQTATALKSAAIPHPEEARLLMACAVCNRGQGATYAEKTNVEKCVAKLDAIGASFDAKHLNGEWRLVYASEAVTRSSPFFWAFRKATKDIAQPLPMLPSALSEALFAITDGIPFASIGKSTQTISGMGEEGVDGKLVSSVEVTLRVFDALLPPNVGYVTTTSRLADEGKGNLKLSVETTEVKDSTWGEIPVFGQAFESVKFPSGEVLEQVKQGSSIVDMKTVYLSEGLRVSTSSDGQLFVHARLHLHQHSDE